MNASRRFFRTVVSCSVLILPYPAFPQIPSLINYQGRLLDGTNLVNGTVGLSLRLYDAATSGTLLYEDSNTVPVVDGLYGTLLGDQTNAGNFATALANSVVYLAVAVNGGAELTPRERVVSVAYALRAGDATTLDGHGSSFFATGTPVFAESDPIWNAQKSGYATGTPVYAESDPKWSGASNLYYLKTQADARYATGTPLYIESDATAWHLSGNAGTAPGANYLGTTDNEPLEIKVNGQRALRIEPGTPPNLIGGGTGNVVATSLAGTFIGGGDGNLVSTDSGWSVIGGGLSNGVYEGSGASVIGGGANNMVQLGGSAAVIGGGGYNTIGTSSYFAVVGGGYSNYVKGCQSGTVGGGDENSILSYSHFSTIGGGQGNTIGTNASSTTIAGGSQNSVGKDSGGGTIAGGDSNTIRTNAINSTIAGGFMNFIDGQARYATIGGGEQNYIGYYADHATIAGGNYNTNGGSYAFVGGGYYNAILTSGWSFVGGGRGNVISNESETAVIAGGYYNAIASNSSSTVIGGGEYNAIAHYSTGSSIGGGLQNTIKKGNQTATISGGDQNTIENDAGYSAIGGGYQNTNHAGAEYATIGGGEANSVAGGANHAVVGGGYQNNAGGIASCVPGGQNCDAANTLTFAAGNRAKAGNAGAFVWADSQDYDFVSTNSDEFAVRAIGGVRFVTAVDGSGNPTAGLQLSPGSGSWTSLSDRNAKENFHDVDTQAILAKVAAMPVQSWNYKTQDPSIRHIGPMAQDFYAAFHVGDAPNGITTIDADGVALAALQALNAKLERENAELMRQLADVQHRLHVLETR